MIRLQWAQDETGLRVRLRGHAGGLKNLEGHDLVCAAASMLCVTLAQTLNDLCEAPLIRVSSGLAELRGTPRPGEAANLSAAWQTVLGGFQWLQAQYPRCLEVAGWI